MQTLKSRRDLILITTDVIGGKTRIKNNHEVVEYQGIHEIVSMTLGFSLVLNPCQGSFTPCFDT